VSLAPGTRLGPYEISALIGVGGMGEVYRATDTTLKRQVAIKVLPYAFAADVERLARFHREAQVLASLNHPNIAQVYGLEEAAGVKALVMELVEGPTLADRIAQGRIPVEEVIQIARQIVDALEAAHEHGIIHRDLKPANVSVRLDGMVKVLDFGLAKALESDLSSPTITTPGLTETGRILGTAAYMSPEQARGQPVDKRADIWAFGCVLYEMLTGRRASEEDASLTDFDSLPDGTPLRVRRALQLCLQKSPRQRGGDIAAIRLVLDGAFESAARPLGGASVALPVWRRTTPLLVALVIGILVTGFAAWRSWPAVQSQAVNRFDHRLRVGQRFRNSGWSPLAVSPDGQSFVYNTSEGLYLRTLGELRARLIAGTEEDLAFPIFSPDGQSVAYVTHRDGSQLKRIAIGGGASAVIADVPPEVTAYPYGASWGPDGTIFFAQPNGIMRVPAAGGTPELVIPAEKGKTLYGPRALPDGDSIIFSVSAGTGAGRWDEAQIVVQSLSSGKRTVVLQGGSDAQYLSTGHLVYALGDSLLGVRFDVDRLAVTGRAVPLVKGVMRATSGLSGSANYGVSDQGTLLYVNAVTGVPSTLVWVDRKGNETPLPAANLDSPQYPRLSPDGTRLALVVAGDLWVYDLGGRPPIKLTFDTGNYSPLWSSNGRRLVYEGTNPVGLYRILADGSERMREPLLVTQDGHFHAHGWSANGDDLLVVDFGQTEDIVRWSPGTSTRQPVVQTQAREGADGASLSADSRWLAYASNQTGRQEIWVQPYGRRGTPVRVSSNGGKEPVWARNGRELFYLQGTRMMAVTVNPEPTFRFDTPEFLFESPYLLLDQPPSYDVAPDGRFLMIKPNEGEQDGALRITVVQNWFEELQRLVPTN